MSKYFNKAFIVDMFDRAISTFAQSMISVLTVSATAGQGIIDANFIDAASIAGLAAVISILSSIAVRGRATDSTIVTSDNATQYEPTTDTPEIDLDVTEEDLTSPADVSTFSENDWVSEDLS